MGFNRSLHSKIAEKTATLMRKMNDLKVQLTGTQASVLRITRSAEDVMGDYTESLDLSILSNIIINYPYNAAEIFVGDRVNEDPSDNQVVSRVKALDIWEFLPIIMRVPFFGDTDVDPVELRYNDIIVDCLFDQHKTKIPIIMQVMRLRGGMWEKHLTSRTYELSLYNGQPEQDIQTAINQYIANLTLPEYSVP